MRADAPAIVIAAGQPEVSKPSLSAVHHCALTKKVSCSVGLKVHADDLAALWARPHSSELRN
jgi:hypothetical protein